MKTTGPGQKPPRSGFSNHGSTQSGLPLSPRSPIDRSRGELAGAAAKMGASRVSDLMKVYRDRLKTIYGTKPEI